MAVLTRVRWARNTMTASWPRVDQRALVVAHRGASATHPENTISAIRAAFDVGADGAEIDVRQCASGEVVVFHDHDLRRLCGASAQVSRRTWQELSQYRVEGEPIPLLDDVLEEMGDRLLNVEIKPVSARETSPLVRATARTIERHRFAKQVIVSSFDPLALAMMRAAAPAVNRALLFHGQQCVPLRRGWGAPWVAATAVHAEDVLASADFVAAWRRRNYAVAVWTVDEPARILELSRAGVNAIITNDPAKALRALCATWEALPPISTLFWKSHSR